MPASGKIRVRKKGTETSTIKEHGYLLAGYDDIRGEWTCNVAIPSSELMV